MKLSVSWLHRYGGYVGMGLIALFVATFIIPSFSWAAAVSAKSNCMSNLKQLAIHAEIYASDHDHLPDARRWTDGLTREGEARASLTCIPSSGIAFSYAMNAKLSGERWSALPTPETHLLFFDSKVMAPNASGDESLLPDPPRHHGTNIGVFADGHSQYLNRALSEEGE